MQTRSTATTSRSLVNGGGLDGGNGAFFATYGNDLHAVGSLAPIIEPVSPESGGDSTSADPRVGRQSEDQMRRSLAVVAVSLVFAALPATAAFADNPGTMGQPGQSCEDLNITHQGFTTGGFSNATGVYANVPESGQGQETNTHAVSQYGVACFQQSMH